MRATRFRERAGDDPRGPIGVGGHSCYEGRSVLADIAENASVVGVWSSLPIPCESNCEERKSRVKRGLYDRTVVVGRRIDGFREKQKILVPTTALLTATSAIVL